MRCHNTEWQFRGVATSYVCVIDRFYIFYWPPVRYLLLCRNNPNNRTLSYNHNLPPLHGIATPSLSRVPYVCVPGWHCSWPTSARRRETVAGSCSAWQRNGASAAATFPEKFGPTTGSKSCSSRKFLAEARRQEVRGSVPDWKWNQVSKAARETKTNGR